MHSRFNQISLQEDTIDYKNVLSLKGMISILSEEIGSQNILKTVHERTVVSIGLDGLDELDKLDVMD